jgi:hypothetical protein
MEPEDPSNAVGKQLRADVPDVLWVPDHRRAGPGARLGHQPPRQLLSPLPTWTWVQHWQRLRQARLVTLWRHVEGKSPASLSRWPWT